MPLDYSKWKDIEVSDDEDDTHPNIDTPSLFRWRHQARLERMAEKQQQKESIAKGKSAVSKRMEEIENKLRDTTLGEKERVKLELEKDEIKKQEEVYLRKEKELEEKERLEPWNVDTIGHEAFSVTRINKISDKKPEPPKLSDEEEDERMRKFFSTNGELLDELAKLESFDATEKFLLEHPRLASEFSASYIAVEALNCAMELKEKEMCVMARQCITIQYLNELATSLGAIPTNPNVIQMFFKKFRIAGLAHIKTFEDDVNRLCERIRKRGKDKRDAAIAEYEAEERAKRIAASPGGLDPQEVYESLPDDMRAAFDSQEVARLQQVAVQMDHEVFQYHLQRCIDSGLWIPDANAKKE